MPSRMDRYEEYELQETGRTTKNQTLYKNMYQEGEYSNIEGIASISKNNEIDLNKLKQMLNKRENENTERKYRTAPIPVVKEDIEDTYSDKKYDIKEILHKARTSAKEDNKHHSLKEVDFEFLKGLNLKDLRSLKDDPDTTDELKELINTITNTSILNQLGDKELSLDMLSELKPTGNTMLDASNGSIKSLIKEELKKTIPKKEGDMDQSFFTTNYSFKAEDFESLEDMKTSIKKNNKMIRILVYFLIFIVIIIVGYFIIKLWK